MNPSVRQIARVCGIVAPLALFGCDFGNPRTPPAAQPPIVETTPPADPTSEDQNASETAPPAGVVKSPQVQEVPPPEATKAPPPDTPKPTQKKKRWLEAPEGADHVFGVTGWIKGVVKLSKEAKAALKAFPRVDMSADGQCAAMYGGNTVLSQQLVLGEKDAVKNVFVRIRPSDLAEYEIPDAPKQAVSVSFKSCLFSPRTFGIRTGQTLRLLNGDPVVHQVLVERNKPFEAALDARSGLEKKEWFEIPELGVELRCGFHIWESAYACVVSHPAWGISNELGQVYIPNVPTGTFTLEFWHPPVPGLKLLEPKQIRVRGVKGGATLFLAMFQPVEEP